MALRPHPAPPLDANLVDVVGLREINAIDVDANMYGIHRLQERRAPRSQTPREAM